MELFLGAISLIVFSTTVAAIEEHLRWRDSYWKAGEDDREYQKARQTTPPYRGDYRE